MRRRALRVLALLAVAGALGGAAFHALRTNEHPPATSRDVASRAAPAPQRPIADAPIIAAPGLGGTTNGAIDVPAQENVVADSITIAGWAADPTGISGVDVRVDDRSFAARYGVTHVEAPAASGDPGSANAGFSFDGKFADLPLERHDVSVVATNRLGQRTALGRRSLVSSSAMSMWSGDLDGSPGLASRRFYFLMATSGVMQGGGKDIERQYAGLTSRTQRVGMSVPILYMRETRGAADDWRFDPAFDLSRKCNDRPVVDDNLDTLIEFAIAQRIPVNFILNGGIWADASCYSLDWDLTTHLELDAGNCQWDQFDAVMPGDYRQGLVGSTHSPELSRSLTYNVYNRAIRAYKRRNLQAAARIVANFARAHPELFVGVSLDADTYMNPFVEGGRHYDYNPGMLRQFREWLSGTGAYAGHPADGAPDLSHYRRRKPLTLAAVNRLAAKHWSSWSQVQPPRELPGSEGVPVAPGGTPFWNDPWYQQWDVFRKHIVQLHYAELAQWTHEAGVPSDRIFTAQAIPPHDPGIRPISTFVASPSPFSDSAGVSIEGAKPPLGHIGVILYGPSAENAMTMEAGHSLFATIGRFDDAWAVAEMNATDLRSPTKLPTYAQSYHAFRDLFNYGGRQVSLMAWNGSYGLLAGRPGYLPYTSWRETPAEQAMMDFLVSHADVPRGALLWTFGSPRLVDADGWTAAQGSFDAAPGALILHPSGDRVVLRSPPDQLIRPSAIGHVRLRLEGGAPPRDVTIKANATINANATIKADVTIKARLDGETNWRTIGRGHGDSILLDWPADWMHANRIVDQLEFTLALTGAAEGARLTRVLLYPSAAEVAAH